MSPLPSLLDLILHRPPALLLDCVLELSDTRCVTLARVESEAWYLQTDGSAPAWVGLEWMAQTASALSGHRHRLAGRAPRIGLLLGTRSYEVSVLSFPVGAELEVEAEVIFLDEAGLGAFRCEVRHSGEILACARLKAIEMP